MTSATTYNLLTKLPPNAAGVRDSQAVLPNLVFLVLGGVAISRRLPFVFLTRFGCRALSLWTGQFFRTEVASLARPPSPFHHPPSYTFNLPVSISQSIFPSRTTHTLVIRLSTVYIETTCLLEPTKTHSQSTFIIKNGKSPFPLDVIQLSVDPYLPTRPALLLQSYGGGYSNGGGYGGGGNCHFSASSPPSPPETEDTDAGFPFLLSLSFRRYLTYDLITPHPTHDTPSYRFDCACAGGGGGECFILFSLNGRRHPGSEPVPSDVR